MKVSVRWGIIGYQVLDSFVRSFGTQRREQITRALWPSVGCWLDVHSLARPGYSYVAISPHSCLIQTIERDSSRERPKRNSSSGGKMQRPISSNREWKKEKGAISKMMKRFFFFFSLGDLIWGQDPINQWSMIAICSSLGNRGHKRFVLSSSSRLNRSRFFRPNFPSSFRFFRSGEENNSSTDSFFVSHESEVFELPTFSVEDEQSRIVISDAIWGRLLMRHRAPSLVNRSNLSRDGL